MTAIAAIAMEHPHMPQKRKTSAVAADKTLQKTIFATVFKICPLNAFPSDRNITFYIDLCLAAHDNVKKFRFDPKIRPFNGEHISGYTRAFGDIPGGKQSDDVFLIFGAMDNGFNRRTKTPFHLPDPGDHLL